MSDWAGLARPANANIRPPWSRWSVERPADVDNLVLLTFDEAEAHEGAKHDLPVVRRMRPALASFVEAKLERVRWEFMY